MSGGDSSSSLNSSVNSAVTGCQACKVAAILREIKEMLSLDFELIISDETIVTRLSQLLVKADSLKNHIDDKKNALFLACEIVVNMLQNEIPYFDNHLAKLNQLQEQYNVSEGHWKKIEDERVAISNAIAQHHLDKAKIDDRIAMVGLNYAAGEIEKKNKILSEIEVLTNRYREIMREIADGHPKRSTMIRELVTAHISYEAAIHRKEILADAWNKIQAIPYN